MKSYSSLFLFIILLIPVIGYADEPSRGTVIMISGVSGWLLLSSAFIFWKEIKRNRNKK